jgi:hypothetical protein
MIATAGKIFANSCLENRFDWEVLAPVIGEPGQTTKFPFPLRCDTVIVPKGRETVVHAGAFLFFQKSAPTNLIRVEGTLALRGVKEHYVLLAGGRDPKLYVPEPAKSVMWGGILVEPGGKLSLEFAGLYGAPTPITAFSKNVKIVNSFFAGGTGIMRPDGTLRELDPQFAAVNSLDFSESPAASQPEETPGTKAGKSSAKSVDTLSHAEKEALLARGKSSWSRPRTWAMLGGGAAAAAVAGYFILQPKDRGEPGAVTPKLDNKPGEPGN